ncbi:hypothetical protein ACFW2X_27635 [Streptomyces antibioticus]|uniref:hypothetical protein n=1 Tax=Streptomyces antibioticus TaxID=1890 RepID=UPI0036CBA4AC
MYEGAGADRKGRLAVERWAGDRRTVLLVRPGGYVAWAAGATDAGVIDAALSAHVG